MQALSNTDWKTILPVDGPSDNTQKARVHLQRSAVSRVRVHERSLKEMGEQGGPNVKKRSLTQKIGIHRQPIQFLCHVHPKIQLLVWYERSESPSCKRPIISSQNIGASWCFTVPVFERPWHNENQKSNKRMMGRSKKTDIFAQSQHQELPAATTFEKWTITDEVKINFNTLIG